MWVLGLSNGIFAWSICLGYLIPEPSSMTLYRLIIYWRINEF